MSYLYDDLLEEHFQKVAFWGAAARGLMRAAPTAAKFGLGAATGIPIGGAGTAGALAGQVSQMMPSAGRAGVGPTFAGMGPKLASRRKKEASHGLLSHALHVSPYAAWAAGHLLEDKHPTLSKALTAGAYLGYAGNSAHEALKNPQERVTSGIDAAALLAMLGSDVARWTRK